MDSSKIKENDMELVKGIKFLGGTDDTDANKYQGKNLKIKVTMDMIQCRNMHHLKLNGITILIVNFIDKLNDLCPEANKYSRIIIKLMIKLSLIE